MSDLKDGCRLSIVRAPACSRHVLGVAWAYGLILFYLAALRRPPTRWLPMIARPSVGI
mgnify:CR=1 FL=1